MLWINLNAWFRLCGERQQTCTSDAVFPNRKFVHNVLSCMWINFLEVSFTPVDKVVDFEVDA